MSNLISTRGNFPSTLSLTRTVRNASSVPKSGIKNNVKASIIEVVGNTPMVRLSHPEKLLTDLNIEDTEILCNINVKLEFLNPGGSIKDRIGRSMIKEARKANALAKDRYLIEASSGNTGIAIAMNGAIAAAENECAGCYIVTNEKCSDEKVSTMKLLGAQICLIKTGASETAVIDRAQNEQPDISVILDQFDNQVNPQTHYHETAEEIHRDLGKWPEMVTLVAGTGGHFTGIATRVKLEHPACLVVAGDPEGSSLFHQNPQPHSFLVEGLTGGPEPINADLSLHDECQVVSDKEAFLTARNIAKYEGILCGGSSGLAVAAALKSIIKNQNSINVPGVDVVVIMPDGIRSYMTKFVLDQWMEAQMFKEIPPRNLRWYNYQITDSNENLFLKVLKQHNIQISVDQTTKADEALKKLSTLSTDAAAIIYDSKGKQFMGTYPLIGLASSNSFRYHLANPHKKPFEDIPDELQALSNPVTHFMEKDMYVVKLLPSSNKNLPTVGLVARMLDIHQYVVLGYERIDQKSDNPHAPFYGKYVATARDLLAFRNCLKFNDGPKDEPKPE